MYSTLTTLIDRLEGPNAARADVIRWGSPVPSFGDLSASKIATIGLNPSNREFVDKEGAELKGVSRRFHTLYSLGINSWSEIDARHLDAIITSCRSYFRGNPYHQWFRRLDEILVGTKTSYYSEKNAACHLDLIPYATAQKWTELSTKQRAILMETAGNSLGMLLRDSPVRILVLNGMSVVREFQSFADVHLKETAMEGWSLPRRSRPDVIGYSYFGTADSLFGVELPRTIVVLGYNHNLQSSFGVTNKVVTSIRDWITSVYGKVAYEAP